MDKLDRGYVQIYTGNGKGKTTAAVGQAIRAVGNGLQVYMLQFLKNEPTGELEVARLIGDKFQIFRFETKKDFFWKLSDEQKLVLQQEINQAYQFALDVIQNNRCSVFILDEIMAVIKNGLLTQQQVIELINQKPIDMELILTGRNLPEAIKEKADLVTEMEDIKHYIQKGVYARQGIEY